MKAADILQLNRELGNRLDALRLELNLAEDHLKPEFPELHAFHRKSGLSQLFYYLFNYDRIRASAEYVALQQLRQRPLLVSSEEVDLLEVFENGIPASPFQISPLLSARIEPLKQALHTKLTTSSLNPVNKDQEIHTFWTTVLNLLEKSSERSDRILARYLKNRRDLGLSLSEEPILLSQAHEVARAPQYLLNLRQSSGTREHLEEASKTYQPEEESLHPAPGFIHAARNPKAPIQVQTQTYVFWWFPCILMSDIHARVQATQDTFNQARDHLAQVKEHAKDYLRPFVDGLISLFEGWKNEKKPQPKPSTQPTPLPAQSAQSSPTLVTKMLTYATSLMPSTSSLVPSSAASAVTASNPWNQFFK